MFRYVTIVALSSCSLSAFAGRGVAVQDLQSDRKIVVESTPVENGLSKFTFYSCGGQNSASVADLDLAQCRPFLNGKSFSLSEVVAAISQNGSRGMLAFLTTDSAYAVRAAKRQIEGQSVDVLNETTYHGSAEGYGFANNPQWLLSTMERSLTGTSDTPGMRVGYSKEEKISNGFFDGAVEGLTALLLYAK